MITAKEMREYANRQYEASLKREIESVLNAIRNVAASGVYTVSINHLGLMLCHTEKIIEKLRELGFRVERDPESSFGTYIISW